MSCDGSLKLGSKYCCFGLARDGDHVLPSCLNHGSGYAVRCEKAGLGPGVSAS